MGIEPTWDLLKPHTGFEDQERHQAACHLHKHYTLPMGDWQGLMARMKVKG